MTKLLKQIDLTIEIEINPIISAEEIVFFSTIFFWSF